MRFTSTALSVVLWTARHSEAFAVSGVIAKTTTRRVWSVAARKHPRRAAGVGGWIVPSSSFSGCGSVHHVRGGAAFFSTQLTASASSTSSTSTAVEEQATSASKHKDAPVEIFRNDYQPLPFTVSNVSLDINIHDDKTTILTEMKLIPNPADASKASSSLILDGDETSVSLHEIRMNGKVLQADVDYKLVPGHLEVFHVPAGGAVLTTVVTTVPADNTQLSGLYKSGNMYCTQCEAMGFRRMTYYPDRPDNMAIFDRVRIEADKMSCPILLANGNRLEEGDVVNDDTSGADANAAFSSRHYAIWSDPFPKPSYLFAVVAGQLGCIHDTYTTRSGRVVDLNVYSEPNNVHKLRYAMESLQRSMKWDEDRFGLEYDLDLYNIVAVESFNMGAMENKGLNIFNTACVLADRRTATDVDFERVLAVIGHEYFHNWTGNRVTCRDWFQLTLKEGLTVFRDQEFSGDMMNSKAVKRIEDVRGLRGRQFNEDAGPMSHPIRPESYISMDNFYTTTVYEKGAEVIRMYQTLLGVQGFNKGMVLYFERHDGSAVTCDDFLAAMADANGVDLSQFALWYSTPGTPTVTYSTDYDSSSGVFSLTLEQSNKNNSPLLIPVSVGLLDKETGEEVVPTKVLELKKASQTFTFDGLKSRGVVPSILRTFSAPVKLQPKSGEGNEEELAFLAARDTDGFNRWEAGQKLYTSLIFQNMDGKQSDKTLDYVYEAFERTLMNKETTDYSMQAYALILPTESTLAEDMEVVDPIGIHTSHGAVKKTIARKFQQELQSRYEELTKELEAEGEFKVDAPSIGRRRLRNVLLEYLCSIRETKEEQITAAELAMNHFCNAAGMTDKMAGLSALASMDGEGAKARDDALKQFYDDAQGDALVLNKWFTAQALANLSDVLDRVKKLTEHPDFTLMNPNRCRSLISAFTMNAAAFHAENGAGYEFIGDMVVELDKLNPQVSSRLAGSLIQWRRYNEKRGGLMKAQLERLAALELSDDLYEIVSRGLK